MDSSKSELSNKSKLGTIYLIHFDKPFSHAKHYLGFVRGKSVDKRMNRHKSGDGSKLLRALNKAGIGWKLVRVWEGKTRDEERRMKNHKNSPRICPVCRSSKI